MKRFLLFLTLVYTFNITAQSELLSVSAEVDITTSAIIVQQNLILNLPDSVQVFKLKALDFKGTTLSDISAKSGETNLNLKESYSEGLNHIELTASNGISLKDISITYKVEVDEANFYLPLFFTNLAAASSDNGFFKMNIKMLQKQAYIIHFPKVEIIEKTANNYKELIFEVPALPSLLRIELFSDEKSGFNFINTVDWLVGVIFVVIGFLIWKNRKKLMYG